ncbi:MAG: energy-coupling factor ABC transporter permease [Opitutales bacterium]
MHLAHGTLDTTPLLMTTAAGMFAFGAACYGARHELCAKQFPSLFAMGIFVLLAHMVNFSIGFGCSGHLLGAGLLAILFGPYSAMLAMGLILGTQATLLGDGAPSTLGANFITMGVCAPWLAHWTFKLLQGRRTPQADSAQTIAVGLAAAVAALGATLSVCALSPVSLAVLLPVNSMAAAIEGLLSMAIFQICLRGLDARLSSLRRFALKPIAALSLLWICLLPVSSQQPDGVEYALSE